MHNRNTLHSTTTAHSTSHHRGPARLANQRADSGFAHRNGHEVDYDKVVSAKVLLLREELQYEDIA